jgi:ligand-binding sensor domain-containing protein
MMLVVAPAAHAQDSWRSFIPEDSGLTITAISSLAVDSAGGVWVGGHYEGVDHFDGTAWRHLADHDWVQSMTVGSDGRLRAFINGSLWEFANGGLGEVDPNGFNEVFHIAVDRKGSVWGAVDPSVFPGDLQNVTVVVYSGGRWTGIGTPFSGRLSAFAVEGDGGASWVGTSDSGAVRLVGLSATPFNTKSGGLPSDTVTDIAAGANGDVWIGTSAGLARYRDGRIIAVGPAEPSDLRIRAIAPDRAGGVWVTTGGFQQTGRLLHFDGASWISVPNPKFAPAGFYQIAVDRSGSLWCVHADGIALYTPAPSSVETGRAAESGGMIVSARPNPFTGGVGIEIALPAASHAVVDVVDVMGRTVRLLTDRDLSSGASSLVWDGRRVDGSLVSDGVYFCRVRGDGGVAVARMVKIGGAR